MALSPMAVFGWTSSPGFFAVFGKPVRHYLRTGQSNVLGHMEPFWSFHWVDDIVLVEVDVEDRLQRAEKRLGDGVKLVFGSDGWHEGKFTTWSRVFHAVGIDWNIPDEHISIPQRKIDKLRTVLTETLEKSFLSRKRLDSVIGILRHMNSFIPITKPFIQRLTAVQNRCRTSTKSGTPVTEFLRKDLQWWRDLAFQSEFAGIPMNLFDLTKAFEDAWLVVADEDTITITSMKLQERLVIIHNGQAKDGDRLAQAVTAVTNTWGSDLTVEDTWCHVVIHGVRCITELIDKMNCRSVTGQQALRQCALSQARYRLHFTTETLERRWKRTTKCDIHSNTGTNISVMQQTSIDSGEWNRCEIKSNRLQLRRETLGSYQRNFKFWEAFCNDFGSPVWIDELPRAEQARMVGLFAALCASEGHSKARKGNKFQTLWRASAIRRFAAQRSSTSSRTQSSREEEAARLPRNFFFFFKLD